MARFAKRLIALREEKNLLQKELAAIIGVEISTVSSWEIGHRVPGLNKLESLADYFRVSTDYLLGRTNVRNYPDNYPATARPDEPVEITVDNIRQLVEGYAEGLIRKRGLVDPPNPDPTKPKK